MEQYQTEIRIIEEGHRREKRNLMKQLKEVKTDMRALKMSNTKLRKNVEERMRIEGYLQKELEAVKKSWEKEMNGMKKLREELRFYRNEKRQLKKELEALKVAKIKHKKQLELERKNNEEEKGILQSRNHELQQELEALNVANIKLKKQLELERENNEEEKGILQSRNHELQQELEALNVANTKLTKQLELERENNEEEKGILQSRNHELQQELEALKARVPTSNLQLASSGSESRGQTETSAQPKLCIDSFQPIRILGQGGFGKVILAKKKVSAGTEQRFALKVIKKSGMIIRRRVTYTVTEKEALILASSHPFITSLYSCFQTKEHLFFVMEYVSGGNMAEELEKVRVFSEERARFYAAEITLALEFLHRYGILHRVYS